MPNLRRLLITNNSLKKIAGSELVVLELVEAFLSRGWRVDAYSPELGQPLEAEFLKLPHAKRLRLTNDVDFPFAERYDLIWIQHSAVPNAIINSFSRKEQSRVPVAWLHLSGLPTAHIEQPLQAHLEQAIADVVAVISNETQRWIAEFGIKREQMWLFDNPAPDRFAESPVILDPNHLKKVLCVSNHPPAEVLEARELLLQAGCQCDMLGHEHACRLEPQMLKAYDAVITIGKTVQYALSMGLPCFIYDHFGGDGWLLEDNFEDNAAYNFSGRNRRRKVRAETLCREVLERFADACRFAQTHREKHAERYRLSRRIDALLDLPAIRQPKNKCLDGGQQTQLRQYAAFVKQTHGTITGMTTRVAELEARCTKLKNSLQRQKLKMAKAEELHANMVKLIDRWNGRSWFKRAFHRLRLPNASLQLVKAPKSKRSAR